MWSSILFAMLHLQGKPLSDATLRAVDFITRGLALCGTDSRYAFLRYNGSVHYWRASQPLRREGSRQLLLSSQEAVCQVKDSHPSVD
jgi:hypothetical protein